MLISRNVQYKDVNITTLSVLLPRGSDISIKVTLLACTFCTKANSRYTDQLQQILYYTSFLDALLTVILIGTRSISQTRLKYIYFFQILKTDHYQSKSVSEYSHLSKLRKRC